MYMQYNEEVILLNYLWDIFRDSEASPFLSLSDEAFNDFITKYPNSVKVYNLLDNNKYKVKVMFITNEEVENVVHTIFTDKYGDEHISKFDELPKNILFSYEFDILHRRLDREVAQHILKLMIYDNYVVNNIMNICTMSMNDFMLQMGEICTYYEPENLTPSKIFMFNKFTKAQRLNLGTEKFTGLMEFFSKIDVNISTGFTSKEDSLVNVMIKYFEDAFNSINDIKQAKCLLKNAIKAMRILHGNKDLYSIENFYFVVDIFLDSAGKRFLTAVMNIELPDKVIKNLAKSNRGSLIKRYLDIKMEDEASNKNSFHTAIQYIDEYELISASHNILNMLFNVTDNVDFIYSLLSSGYLQYCESHDPESIYYIYRTIFCDDSMKELLKNVGYECVNPPFSPIVINRNMSVNLSDIRRFLNNKGLNGDDFIKRLYALWDELSYDIKEKSLRNHARNDDVLIYIAKLVFAHIMIEYCDTDYAKINISDDEIIALYKILDALYCDIHTLQLIRESAYTESEVIYYTESRELALMERFKELKECTGLDLFEHINKSFLLPENIIKRTWYLFNHGYGKYTWVSDRTYIRKTIEDNHILFTDKLSPLFVSFDKLRVKDDDSFMFITK